MVFLFRPGKSSPVSPARGGIAGQDCELLWSTRVTKNSKSEITNIKQITMTEIVRASLGLPTLRAGPQFQNSKPVWVIEYWNLVLGI